MKSIYFVHFAWQNLEGKDEHDHQFLDAKEELIGPYEINHWESELRLKGYTEAVIENYILSETIFDEGEEESNWITGLDDEELAIVAYAVETADDHVEEDTQWTRGFIQRHHLLNILLDKEYDRRRLNYKMFEEAKK